MGEKLKKLRSERRISLNEISRATRIQVKYLEYLEDGAYGKLPADVYVKGFLRNYSEFLGIDEKILIRLYEKEQDIRSNLEKSKGKKNSPADGGKISISSFVVTPRMLGISAIIITVFGGFFYLYREVGSFASTPRLVIINPDKNYSTSGNSVMVEGVTDRDTKIFINDQPIPVNDDGKFRETLTVQSGSNAIVIRAVNRFDKEIAEKLIIQSTYREPAEPEPVRDNQPVPADNFRGLFLELRVDPGPVWVSVEADGNLVFSGTMLTGAVQNFSATGKISVNSGKGSATFVKFNGKDIGALSDNSKPVRGATFTPNTNF